MGISDPFSGDIVSLQIVVAAGSITLGFATGAGVAWVLRMRHRAKLAGARLDRYVPEQPSAALESATEEKSAKDESDEPPPAASAGRERRKHPRLDFFGTQWIAPFSGGALPVPAEFIEVRCLDISTGGFSFATGETPAYQSIVVRFQVGGSPMYLTARLANCRPFEQLPGRQFRVGCEFTGRLSMEGPSPPVTNVTDAIPPLAPVNPPAASLGPALQQN